MAFSDFLDRIARRRTDDLTARAERAGKAGVEAARKVAPVKTGRLRDSIGFLWNQSTMTLTLFCDVEYGHAQNLKRHFMDAGWAAMRQMFKGGNTEIQFPTLPEKYQAKARLLSGGKGTIIGHRGVRKTR